MPEDVIDVTIRLPELHECQMAVKESKAKRKVVRTGRRGGKTVLGFEMGTEAFLSGKRVLYAAPTAEQVGKFWYEVTTALEPLLLSSGLYKKNESEHYIEKIGTEERIKAKTAWNADSLRGDYAGLLILDEFQLMNEDTWEIVGAPMLLDNDGDVIFFYTPPSLRSAGLSKAHDPRHAAKLFRVAMADGIRWEAFTWTSHDNEFLNKNALAEIVKDMSKHAYQQEILGQDDEIELSWLVYRVFNEDVCKKPREDIPKTWHIYSGHDFGEANPGALFVAQDPATGQFWEFKEYFPGPGVSIYKQVEEFKSITEGYKVMGSWGGSHMEDGIRQAYTAHGWTIREPKWNRVNEQLERVIAMMERDKIYIFDDLTLRLEELMSCTWDSDIEGNRLDKIKNKGKYHICDCAMYLYCNFTPETVVATKPMVQYGNLWKRRSKVWNILKR